MVVRIMALFVFLLGLWLVLTAGFGPGGIERGNFAIAGSILLAAGLIVFAKDDCKREQ